MRRRSALLRPARASAPTHVVRAATAVLLAATAVPPLLAEPPAAEATTPTYPTTTPGFGAGTEVTFGQVQDFTLPITVELPVPTDANGRVETATRVTTLEVSYSVTPITTGPDWLRTSVPTPHCIAGQPCRVELTLPTHRMPTSRRIGFTPAITFDAYTDNQDAYTNAAALGLPVRNSAGEVLLGATWRPFLAPHIRPTVQLTAPRGDRIFSGGVTLSAEAQSAPGGAPVKQVRFYVNPKDDRAPYVVDTSPPYQVVIPADDIAAPLTSGTVWAVAEDEDGLLSVDTYDPDTQEHWSWSSIGIGPLPEIGWAEPATDGQVAGSVRSSFGAALSWTARIPDEVPDFVPYGWDAAAEKVHLSRIRILIDGQPWRDYRPDLWPLRGEHRAFTWDELWRIQDGLTAGSHTATLEVTTNYGTVATRDVRFRVSDGIQFSPVRHGSTVVRNGYVVTAGSTRTFTTTVSGNVPNTPLWAWSMSAPTGRLQTASAGVDGVTSCAAISATDCPTSRAIRGTWTAPRRAGTYELHFSGQEWTRDRLGMPAQEITRRIKVQPAAVLTAAVSDTRVRAGSAVTVRGRLLRSDTRAGVREVPVTLQWKRNGGTRWTTLLRRTTAREGRLAAKVVRRHTGAGAYRWRTSGVLGRIGPGTSPAVTVRVRR